MRKDKTERVDSGNQQVHQPSSIQNINTSDLRESPPPEDKIKESYSFSWKSLSKTQQWLAVLSILVLAVFMPEIAFIVDFAGIESAILFLLYYFKPQLNWMSLKLSQIRQDFRIGVQLLRQTLAVTGKGFSVSTTFSCGLVYLTSSFVLGGIIWMPALLMLQQVPI